MQHSNSRQQTQDDLEAIASDISRSNFNIRQFRKTHAAKPIRQFAHNKTVSSGLYLKTTQNNSLIFQKHAKTTQGLNQTLRYNQTFIAPNKKQKKINNFFNKGGHKSWDSRVKTRSIQKSAYKNDAKMKSMATTVQKQSIQKWQKQFSKGPVRDGCLESWLNAVLVEHLNNQYFDPKIPNSALKKMGIDDNSLIAKGLNQNNVSRLYRGLFVFGMGFNDLLKQLAHGRSQLVKTIWRIYSIVLQYCSQGSMQTVIGNIDRENDLKFIELTNQLARKQEIIQKNEQLNQAKNHNIYKQVKMLRQQTKNLTNQKDVLQQQYNATDQAFSEEISLRLKFQTKINELYGLHRELGVKHQKLCKDLQKKIQQMEGTAGKYNDVALQFKQFKEIQLGIRQQYLLQNQKAIRLQKCLQQMSNQRIQLHGQLRRLQIQIIDCKAKIREYVNKQKQWTIDKSNMQVILNMRQKSAKQTHQEYQITLEQNNRLYIQLSDMRKVMQSYQKQKSGFNVKVISIVSQNSYHKRKLEQLQKKYLQMEQGMQASLQQMQRIKQQNIVRTKNQQDYKSYHRETQEGLKQLKAINVQLEDELNYLRKYESNMTTMLKIRNQKEDQMQKQLLGATSQSQTLKNKLSTLESNYKRAVEKANHIEAISATSLDQIKQLQQKILTMTELHDQKQLALMMKFQRTKDDLSQMILNFKNQKFQRMTLNNSYQQSLRIIQSKNQQQKNYQVKISLLQGQVSQQKQNFKILQKNVVKLVAEYSQFQQNLDITLQQQRVIIRDRMNHVHPMIVQDMAAIINRQEISVAAYKKNNQILETQIEEIKKTHKNEVERIQREHNWNYGKMKNQLQNRIQYLQRQNTYQKQQNKELNTSKKQIQQALGQYKRKAYEKKTSERQQLYKFMLQQKKKQIQTILGEMDKLNDQIVKNKRHIAQLSTAHTLAKLDSQQELKNQLSKMIRKEFQLQYQQKIKEAQLKLRLARTQEDQQDHLQSQQLQKVSWSEFLRKKGITVQQAIQELFVKHQKRQLHLRGTQRQFALKRQMQGMSKQLWNRKKIVRLIRNSKDYYRKDK